ncbi:MAG: hypothetical protein HGB18_04345 [Candidatus Moranbacteria bacterium]|nr:hypothetical protein [Candidatus Moranbacteria bacterium]
MATKTDYAIIIRHRPITFHYGKRADPFGSTRTRIYSRSIFPLIADDRRNSDRQNQKDSKDAQIFQRSQGVSSDFDRTDPRHGGRFGRIDTIRRRNPGKAREKHAGYECFLHRSFPFNLFRNS